MKIKKIFFFFLCVLWDIRSEAMLTHSPKLNGVYWGCFDPPTLAHKAIILKSLHEIPLKELLVIVNDDRRKSYTYPLAKRCRMLTEMFSSEKRIKILSQSDEDRLDYSRLKKMGYTPLCAIAGYDSYKKWIQYSRQEDRALYDQIAVIPRADEEPILYDKNAFLLDIGDHYRFFSSRRVKKLLTQSKDVSKFVDPDILYLIKESKL